LLRARAATLEQSKATLTLAQAEFDRASKLRATNVTSAEEFDQKRETFDVAQAQVHQALENVYQARAALGLPGDPGQGKNLTDVPPNLDQTFSAVRQALAELMQAAAQLGVIPSSYDLTPKQTLEEFYRRDPGGDINRIYADLIQTAPACARLLAVRRAKVCHKRPGMSKQDQLDLRQELYRISGVDLTRIDGISLQTAQKVFFEIGTDVSAWNDLEAIQFLAGAEPQPSHQRRQGAQTQQSQGR
jgi:hypothetical protein